MSINTVCYKGSFILQHLLHCPTHSCLLQFDTFPCPTLSMNNIPFQNTPQTFNGSGLTSWSRPSIDTVLIQRVKFAKSLLREYAQEVCGAEYLILYFKYISLLN